MKVYCASREIDRFMEVLRDEDEEPLVTTGSGGWFLTLDGARIHVTAPAGPHDNYLPEGWSFATFPDLGIDEYPVAPEEIVAPEQWAAARGVKWKLRAA